MGYSCVGCDAAIEIFGSRASDAMEISDGPWRLPLKSFLGANVRFESRNA